MAKDIFDHAGDFIDRLRTQFGGENRHFSGDADFDQAWDDLDAWLKSDAPQDRTGYGYTLDEFDRRIRDLGHEPRGNESRSGESRSDPDASRSGKQGAARPAGSAGPSRPAPFPESILKDFSNLETSPGFDQDAVKAAYKKVLLKYHPDRFAQDPQKQAIATEITVKVNASYQRVMDWLQSR